MFLSCKRSLGPPLFGHLPVGDGKPILSGHRRRQSSSERRLAALQMIGARSRLVFCMSDDEQMKADLRATLFRRAEQPPQGALFLEQYKLYLQMVDKIGDRRQSANSFFLSINTGLCALLGYMFMR